MAQLTIEQAVQIALGHHQAGRVAEAEEVYRQVLEQVPNHADALHLLGVLVGQLDQTKAAIDLIDRAIAIDPTVAEYHHNLGETYFRAGHWEGAIACYRRAIALKPSLASLYISLGVALHASGRRDEVIVAYRQAIALRDDDPIAHRNLGMALHEAGRLDEAIVAYRRAIALRDDDPIVHRNFGIALHEAGWRDEAIVAYRRAIALKPNYAIAYCNLGNVLREKGCLDEAFQVCCRAIELEPEGDQSHIEMGNVLREKGCLDAAVAAFERAIELKANHADSHINLGGVLQDQGRLDEALACFSKASELKPGDSKIASNFLLLLHAHSGYDAQALLAEHRRWATRFAEPLAAQICPHQRDRAPDRRLRVGYVSPDFRAHAVGELLLSLFSNHDRRQVTIIGYSDVQRPDEHTRMLEALADEWHVTVGLNDETFADRIRADRIDILVDLALHTPGNRMLVFARKPAPVQVTMIGLPATTGLNTIDYRLTDPYLDPPGTSDDDYTEQSIRLPHCFWVFRPPNEALPVGVLPAQSKGFVTFGCLNHPIKISPLALQLWVTILRSLPDSRLVLQSHAGSHLEAMRALFQTGGVAGDRIEVRARAKRFEYLRQFQSLDLCLDPFPYNGHTSTLDSLWMGVPVITLTGRTAVGRGGVSILSNLRLPELIARTPQQYVAIAVGLAGDLDRLAQLRSELRQRMRSSPLMDGKQYAGDVETAFRWMWKTWCSR